MKSPDTVVVASAADESYAIPLAVMLRSATDALAPGRELVAWIVDDGVGAALKSRIVQSLPSRASVRWLTPNRERLRGLPLWGRMPATTYEKLTIAESLPGEVTKAIWLDCDMLVLTDLAELWDRPLGDAHALAVTDPLVPMLASRFGVSGFSDLGFDRTSPYFNAGMLVIDTLRWRASGISVAAMEYLERFRDRVVFWDQEALNAALYDKWTAIDPRWNWSANLDRLDRNGGAEYGGVSGRPRILHFAGNLKPWVIRESGKADTAYFNVLDRTAWRGWRPDRTIARSLIGWYASSRVRRFLYPAEHLGMHAVHRFSRRYS